ncbi:MAG: hypothetical protein DRI89_12820 [Bacteroidetes bacterium]|nr:MAG: hypothetical protein DRI89_12820 [Bacteroidota bacterium]
MFHIIFTVLNKIQTILNFKNMKKTMLKKTNLIVLLGLFFLGTLTMQAQVAVNSTGAAPDGNSMLDVTSTNKGVLIPRVDYTTISALTTKGLLFYVTVHGPDGDGFYYYDGTNWIRLIDGTIPLAVTKGGTGTTTVFQTGSVVFVDGAGNYNFSPNFFWDDTPNQWLGLGTSVPISNLHVFEMTNDILPAIVIEQDNLSDGTLAAGDASMLYRLLYSNNGVDTYDEITTGIDEDDNHNFEISNIAGLSGTAPGAYNDANTMMRMHTENSIPGITDFNHQSRARVWLSQPQSIPTATWTQVDFDQNTYDEHNEFSLTVPAQFTALEDGYYQVNARTEFDVQVFEGLQTNGYVSIAIYKNGIPHSLGNNLQIDGGAGVLPEEPMSLINNNAPNVSDVVYLLAGETISIWVYQDFTMTAGSFADIRPNPEVTYASIHKVS